MSEKTRQIAEEMGAEVVEELPAKPVRGALGAARLLERLRSRLEPGTGVRPGRPSVPEWDRRPKVPMSEATERRLRELADLATTAERRVSPMQVAAQLLEDAVRQTGS